MQHKIPKISEVNLELIDVHFYYDQELKAEDIGVSISTKAAFNKNNSIIFFIHVRYLLDTPGNEKLSLFHTDYISQIQIEKVDWSVSEKIEIEKTYLAHLLGAPLKTPEFSYLDIWQYINQTRPCLKGTSSIN